MRKKNKILELCQKIMGDPIADILENFSIEKSRLFYEKHSKQWAAGEVYENPVDKHEKVNFAFAGLDDLTEQSTQAYNLFSNMGKVEFVKKVSWGVYGQNIVVGWHRLKTFEEWLHDGLKDAITQHYKNPEKTVEIALRKEFGNGYYSNAAIHLWLEGKIDNEVLARLSKIEGSWVTRDRDLEDDIKEATGALLEKEEKNDVTVLTFKISQDEKR